MASKATNDGQASTKKGPKFELNVSTLTPPLAITSVYLFGLKVVLKETASSGVGENPLIFQDVSLLPPIIGTLAYIALVVVGKKFMANRKAANIESYVFVYNIYQCLLNTWAVGAFIYELFANGMSVWGNPADPTQSGYKMAFLIWLHYNNKYVELLDTAFMVLKKNNHQISFLHVFHHALLIWSWYIVCRVCPGGDSYFGAMVNSFIHVLMYTYYLCKAMNIHIPGVLKRALTKTQIVQFVVCLSHSQYVIWFGGYPTFFRLLGAWETFVMLTMLVLFGNFYRQSYLNKQKKKQAKQDADTANAAGTVPNKKSD